MELYVWYDDSGQIIRGFQLCYDVGKDEHSFIWKKPGWWIHERIDDGGGSPQANRTPISIPDGVFEPKQLLEAFLEQAGDLESELVELVRAMLSQADGSEI